MQREEDMENRKRFSFNIIDVIAVLLILAVALFAGYRHFLGSEAGSSETVQITYWVKAEGVDASLYESVSSHLPCRMMASGAVLPGTIESVEQYPYLVLSGSGEWVEDPDHTNLVFKVTATVEKQGLMLTKIGDQEIRIGKPHLLKGEWLEFYNTVVVDVDWGD